MIRKLWIDSRQGVGATNDFTVELPLQVTTTKEQGCLVGQFSIPNVFSSVMRDYNDRLYFRVDGVNVDNTIQQNVNDRFYWGYRSNGQQTWLITTLPPGASSAVQLAIAMGNAIIAVLGPVATVVQPPSGPPVLNFNQSAYQIYIPGYQDITDAQWRREVWRGAAYDLNDTRSVGCIILPTPSFQATWSTDIESPSAFIDYNICNLIAPGAYTGATFATQLQSALNYENATTGNTVTCTYQPDDGVIRVQSTRALVIFDPNLLGNLRWQADEWFAPKYRRLGTVMNPSDLRMANHIAYGGPDFDFLTYPLDLSGIREVYIHSSISDNGTLSISGMRSCICVVQVDESWGSVITYRPFSLADSDVIRLQDGTLGPTIRFWLTDYLGRPLPITEGYVFLQLSIVPLNTMDT